MPRYIGQSLKPQILKLYSEGMSGDEIKEILNLPVTVRSIQRLIKSAGLTRTQSESFKLAIKKGRMKYKKLGMGMGAQEFRKTIGIKIRYSTLQRDNFKCVLCGHDASDGRKLEVDHIVRPILGGKNTLDNLRTLCSVCNIGRWHAEQKNSSPHGD